MLLSVPPTRIEIVGIRSGTRLDVKENEEVELKCVVHDARPKARIVWYRENVEFRSGKRLREAKQIEKKNMRERNMFINLI